MVTIEVTGIGHDLYYSGVVSEKIHSGELCGKKMLFSSRVAKAKTTIKVWWIHSKVICRYQIYFKYFYSLSMKLAGYTEYYTRYWDI